MNEYKRSNHSNTNKSLRERADSPDRRRVDERKGKPAANSVAKAGARPASRRDDSPRAAAKPASKPASRRDDSPRAAAKPAGKPASKPAAKPAAQETSKSPCPYYKKCGSCKYLHLSYDKQLKKKEEQLKELCGKFVKFDPMIGMENPYFYRCKVHAVFGERKHEIISGIYEEKTHNIVPVEKCLLEDENADSIIGSVRELMKSFKIRPYNEDTGYGLLRHVLIRMGRFTGQIMVVLVLASPILPSKNNFVKALRKLHPEIDTIVLNVNERNTNMVLGERDIVLYGKGYIEDEILGKTFRISPQSFYQVNPVQTQVLYGKAMEFAGLTGKEVVLDAYCGTGTIGIIASDKAKQVIGVELNRAAVRDAGVNARRNNVENITFYEKDAGVFMTQMAEQDAHVDVVLMDPPRTGSSEEFLKAVVKLAPRKVVYVSCDPATLARDLEFITKKGYRVKRGVGVDMFPWTAGIEAVCLLEKTN